MPSEWYENNPLSVIESLSAGTPVAGAAIGGIPELIGDGDGTLFEPGDADSLCRAITTAAETVWDHDAIASRCGRSQLRDGAMTSDSMPLIEASAMRHGADDMGLTARYNGISIGGEGSTMYLDDLRLIY